VKTTDSLPDGTVFPPSELPLNEDGSVYHLALKPEFLADTVILVGDPGRVSMISSRFDQIEHRVSHREFTTHTGRIGKHRLTVVSTGIGTDNIDIVLNELDALRSIDLNRRTPLAEPNPLRLIRVGTSGGLKKEMEPGSLVHTRYAIGLDALMHFYTDLFEEDEKQLVEAFVRHVDWSIDNLRPYAVRNSPDLGARFDNGFIQGITLTSCGFYGPQGRKLRLTPAMPELNESFRNFSFRNLPLANYEMESSGLLGLGGALGHHCTTVCLVVANRVSNAFSSDYRSDMAKLIDRVLDVLTED
jgi:uridine phosphorylase